VYSLLADAVVVFHFLFIVFVIAGGVLALDGLGASAHGSLGSRY